VVIWHCFNFLICDWCWWFVFMWAHEVFRASSTKLKGWRNFQPFYPTSRTFFHGQGELKAIFTICSLNFLLQFDPCIFSLFGIWLGVLFFSPWYKDLAIAREFFGASLMLSFAK
jgi:hypothetical protein